MTDAQSDVRDTMLHSERRGTVSLEELARQVGVSRERIERYAGRRVETGGNGHLLAKVTAPPDPESRAAAPDLAAIRRELQAEHQADLTALKREIETALEAQNDALVQAVHAIFERHGS